MTVGKTLGTLDLYDVLTDLIPGTMMIVTVLVLFPSLIEELGSVKVLWVVVLFGGYVAGHFIRAVRDLGPPVTDFQERIQAAGPHFDKCVRDQIQEQFDLPESVEGSSTLYQDVSDGSVMPLVLSYLETRPVVRAHRMQSMYSFYRSMYAAAFLILGIAVFSAILKVVWGISGASWGTIDILILLSLINIPVFHTRRKKFKNRFVNYTILDYYVDSVTNDS